MSADSVRTKPNLSAWLVSTLLLYTLTGKEFRMSISLSTLVASFLLVEGLMSSDVLTVLNPRSLFYSKFGNAVTSTPPSIWASSTWKAAASIVRKRVTLVWANPKGWNESDYGLLPADMAIRRQKLQRIDHSESITGYAIQWNAWSQDGRRIDILKNT